MGTLLKNRFFLISIGFCNLVWAEIPANTATGEAPAAIAERQAREREAKILKSGTDKQRWAEMILYSSSKKAEDLEVPLLKAAESKMQLQPQNGHLIFTYGRKSDAFVAGVPHGSKNNVCPAYKFDVIQADAGMALVRKICPGFEYGAQAGKEPKYHWEVSYLLYDSQTSSLAVLWNNVQSTRGDPNPDPKPTQLKVKRVQNGYEVEWDAVNPVYRSKFRLHTRYTAEKVDGKLQLVCRDLTAPKGEERGVNCELGQLSRVP